LEIARVDKNDVPARGDAAGLGRLKEQQEAWETFAASVVQMIPVLIQQMESVTRQTERAAMDLMVHIGALAPPNAFDDASPHLSKIVMAIQFQDITRQQLEQVAKALDYWRTHLQELLKGPQDEGARKEIAILQQLEQTYRTEAERDLHASGITADSHWPAPSETEQGEKGPKPVTLF
jgi:chemotaxis regulatin CheY-phosphate phosphatase CheZ